MPVRVGSNIDVAVIEVVVGQIPVSSAPVSGKSRDKRNHSRLVKANSVRQDLNGWLGLFRAAGHTKLGADVVRASCGCVSCKRGLGEVSALLSIVLDESGGIQVGLRNGDIKDTSTS